MLKALSGNKHTFITGLAVYDSQTGKMRSRASTCNIYFRSLSDDEIKDYCNRYPVLTFAGSLEIDGVIRFSEKIEGNCNFVTAMPLQHLVQFLREIEQDREERFHLMFFRGRSSKQSLPLTNRTKASDHKHSGLKSCANLRFAHDLTINR